jgi:hypothetical protein
LSRQPAAFVSYVRLDGQNEDGKLTDYWLRLNSWP